ncbi:hypothetical protein ES703_70907 [subsurface metagenome]
MINSEFQTAQSEEVVISNMDFTGSWAGSAIYYAGFEFSPSMQIIQTGNSFSGNAVMWGPPCTVSGLISGNIINFTMVLISDPGMYQIYNGNVSGNTISGSFIDPATGGTFSVTKQ